MSNLPSLAQLTVGFALLGGIVALIRYWGDPAKLTLEAVIRNLLAASSVPPAAFLLVCAFDSTLLKYLNDLSLYLAAAGAALLYVSIKDLTRG